MACKVGEEGIRENGRRPLRRGIDLNDLRIQRIGRKYIERDTFGT
jgi:hypothetical protein